jgi:hypothetical protein
MRYVMLLVLLGGCAEPDNISGPAPDLGTAHDAGPETGAAAGAGGGSGGAGGAPACTAALETLNGQATYVQGSAMAVDPTAATTLPGFPTCADWVLAVSHGITSIRVIDGKFGSAAIMLISSMPAGGSCSYTVRIRQEASDAVNEPCAYTADFALILDPP